MVHRRETWADRVARGGAPHRRAAERLISVLEMPYFATPSRLPCQAPVLPDFGVKLLSKAPCQGVFEASNAKRNSLI